MNLKTFLAILLFLAFVALNGCLTNKEIKKEEINVSKGYEEKEKNESKNESKKVNRIFTKKDDEIKNNDSLEEDKQDIVCITLYDPVCGEDNITYSNECFAYANKTKIKYKGICK